MHQGGGRGRRPCSGVRAHQQLRRAGPERNNQGLRRRQPPHRVYPPAGRPDQGVLQRASRDVRGPPGTEEAGRLPQEGGVSGGGHVREGLRLSGGRDPRRHTHRTRGVRCLGEGAFGGRSRAQGGGGWAEGIPLDASRHEGQDGGLRRQGRPRGPLRDTLHDIRQTASGRRDRGVLLLVGCGPPRRHLRDGEGDRGDEDGRGLPQARGCEDHSIHTASVHLAPPSPRIQGGRSPRAVRRPYLPGRGRLLRTDAGGITVHERCPRHVPGGPYAASAGLSTRRRGPQVGRTARWQTPLRVPVVAVGHILRAAAVQGAGFPRLLVRIRSRSRVLRDGQRRPDAVSSFRNEPRQGP